MTIALARGAEQAFPHRAQIPCDVSAIGDSAARCLVMELETWPKPGLVSDIDSGSHDDMDAGTFRRSAAAIKPYFQDLADAAAQGCGMGRLRIIGLEAEGAMFAATSGVNTHRGAIFGLGLLCAAAGARAGGLVGSRTAFGRCRRAALGRQHTRWPGVVAQPWQRGPPPLSRWRCPL